MSGTQREILTGGGIKEARPASTGVIVAGPLRERARIEISAAAVLKG